jgi:hypothetical protein
LDYACGILPDEAVQPHLSECAACREQLEELRKTIACLDNAGPELVFADIHDLHADGSSTTYSSFRMAAESQWIRFSSMRYHHALSIFVNGESIPFKISESSDGEMNEYEMELSRPLSAGESVSVLYVCNTAAGIGASIDIGHGRWVAVPDNSNSGTQDTLLVQMVRLPEDAKLLGSIPSADEMRTGGRTTLVWRRIIRPNETPERVVVVYSL